MVTHPYFQSLAALALAIAASAGLAAGPAAAETTRELDGKASAQVLERLSLLANNALTPNAFDEMLGSLSKHARDRIAETPFAGHDRVNAAVERVRRTYRAAYGRDLHISAEVFKGVRPVHDGDLDHALARAGADIRLAREAYTGNPWRVELVNPTADRLADALVRHFNTLSRTPWPKDAVAGQRLAAQHVFEALTESRPVGIVQHAVDR